VDRSGEPTPRNQRPPLPASAVGLCNEPTARRLVDTRLEAGVDYRGVEVGVVLAHHRCFLLLLPIRQEGVDDSREIAPGRSGMEEPGWRAVTVSKLCIPRELSEFRG